MQHVVPDNVALIIYYTAFYSAYIFTRSCEKGPGNRKTLANGKGISRIPFRTEKEDYLCRLSTISEKIFRKIAFPFDLKPKFPGFFWVNGKQPSSPGWLRSGKQLIKQPYCLLLPNRSPLQKNPKRIQTTRGHVT